MNLRRPRIALVFEFGTLNGGERSMLAAVERLAGKQVDVTALAPRQGRLAQALSHAGISHVPLELHDNSSVRVSPTEAVGRLMRAIRSSSPDLVHANSLSMGRLTGAISDEAAIPTIAHLRDILKLSRAATADLNRNQLLLAVSEATRNFHIAQGIDAGRTRVLYNGVDCDRFRPRPPTGWLKRELELPEASFLAATIGQIGLRKGQDVLAEAAALAADRTTNIHYLLVGERNSSKAESVEFERKIAHRFESAGLGKRLHRLGYREDVDRLLNEVDLLVHPAHQEPLGRVLLEAAAAGTPIVATAVGGTTEILRDGESARLVPANAPQALAAAIAELYDDAEKRAEFAGAARQQVERAFSIERAARELAAVWTQGIHREPTN